HTAGVPPPGGRAGPCAGGRAHRHGGARQPVPGAGGGACLRLLLHPRVGVPGAGGMTRHRALTRFLLARMADSAAALHQEYVATRVRMGATPRQAEELWQRSRTRRQAERTLSRYRREAATLPEAVLLERVHAYDGHPDYDTAWNQKDI